jgi:hypothetical protein
MEKWIKNSPSPDNMEEKGPSKVLGVIINFRSHAKKFSPVLPLSVVL